MNNYCLISDSTNDMGAELAQKYDVQVMPMEVTLDGEVFQHYLDFRNCSVEKFYQKLSDGASASTSQITPQKYLDYFTPILQEGKDILYLCFSSGLSSTYQSSVMAVNELKTQFPERKIITVDTLAASGGEGLMVLYAARNRENGMSIEENAKWVEDNRLNFAHWFTVNDLFFLKKGGRVSSTTAIVGSALKIKPVLHVDNEGHLINMMKAHGRKASITALFNKCKETILDPANATVLISHAACLEEAEELKKRVLEEIGVKEVFITPIGPVIGCHTGQGCMTLFFVGKER